MALTENPISLIIWSIVIGKFSESVLLVFIVLSFIKLACWPSKSATTMHMILLPISLILSAVLPCLHSLSFFFAFFELPYKGISITIKKFPISTLLVELIIPLKCGSILPRLFASSMSLIILPISLIFSTTHWVIFSISMSLIILPFSIIIVAVWME
jgi:hypothetical protein